MATRTPIELDNERIAELTELEEKRLDDSTQTSGRWFERARKSLSGGVASSYQLRDPWPIYLERGEGANVWDVDGNERIDYHNGFGSMVQGHAHPAIVEGGRRPGRPGHPLRRADRGLDRRQRGSWRRRWGLPLWRYVNSGTEATMDAIRIARAYTGRDTVMKILGSYHGHHDYAMVCIGVPYDEHRRPRGLPVAAVWRAASRRPSAT